LTGFWVVVLWGQNKHKEVTMSDHERTKPMSISENHAKFDSIISSLLASNSPFIIDTNNDGNSYVCKLLVPIYYDAYGVLVRDIPEWAHSVKKMASDGRYPEGYYAIYFKSGERGI